MGVLFGGGDGGAALPPIQREPAITNAQAQAASASDTLARAATRRARRGTLLTNNRSLITGILNDEGILS